MVMEKRISLQHRGIASQVGEFRIARALPHPTVRSVGPFVFVDHFPDLHFEPRTPQPRDGSEAHPHRGIATLSYSIDGGFSHYDSLGNASVISGGGAQLLRAGNGVVHDGGLSEEFQKRGGTVNAMQFWVNLSAEHKKDHPDYLGLPSEDVPEIEIDRNLLRVVLGTQGTSTSSLPTYGDEFLYHLVVESESSLTVDIEPGLETALFVARGAVIVNRSPVTMTELAVLDIDGDKMTVVNPSNDVAHVMLFGGSPYTEPIVFGGPFVMNSTAELDEAYKAYARGDYGQVTYPHSPTTN